MIALPNTAKKSIKDRGKGAVKLRSDRVLLSDLSLPSIWVHNGQQYLQLAPLDPDAVGFKYGMLVSCHRSPKHPKLKQSR